MTHNTPPRPTSSRPRPAPGDDLRNRPRPSSPSPSGDEVELESKTHTTENPLHIVPGTRSNPTTQTRTPADPNDDPCTGRWWDTYGCADALCSTHGRKDTSS